MASQENNEQREPMPCPYKTSHEICVGNLINRHTAYFIIKTKEVRGDSIEVYALLDYEGKPHIGKKIDGSADWDILCSTELADLSLDARFKEITDDFVSDDRDKITGAELRDLYIKWFIHFIIKSVPNTYADAIAFCYNAYKEKKEFKAKKQGIQKAIEDAAKQGDMNTVRIHVEELGKLERKEKKTKIKW